MAVAYFYFVNADLIASGLSPLQPELAAIKAGRLLLNEIDRLAASSLDDRARSMKKLNPNPENRNAHGILGRHRQGIYQGVGRRRSTKFP